MRQEVLSLAARSRLAIRIADLGTTRTLHELLGRRTAQQLVATEQNCLRQIQRRVVRGRGQGKKALALSVTLQAMDRTLTDVEIDAVADKVVANVAKATGATLRG